MSGCHSEPGILVLFCCETTFQRSCGQKTVRKAVKWMHFLLLYQCKVSKGLDVSGHQCRCELQLGNPTPSKLLTVAPHNPNSERKKVPLQPESVQHSPSASAETPYFERQVQTHLTKSMPKIKQGSEEKEGDWFVWQLWVTSGLVEAMKLITWSVARLRFKMPETKYSTLQDSLKPSGSVLKARSFAAFCFPEFQIFIITDTMMPFWICKKGEVVQSYNSLAVLFRTWDMAGRGLFHKYCCQSNDQKRI